MDSCIKLFQKFTGNFFFSWHLDLHYYIHLPKLGCSIVEALEAATSHPAKAINIYGNLWLEEQYSFLILMIIFVFAFWVTLLISENVILATNMYAALGQKGTLAYGADADLVLGSVPRCLFLDHQCT